MREGRGNPIIDAAPARKHILALSRQHVGYESVAAAASVPASIVAGIRSGARPKARRQTIERILSVTAAARADHAVVPVGERLWRLLEELLEEGYSKAALARALNYRGKALQFDRRRVTVRSFHNVSVLHRQIMQGTLPAARLARMLALSDSASQRPGQRLRARERCPIQPNMPTP